MSGAVFLSYASQDAEPARRICEALRTAGVDVWFDQSELRGGDSWDAKIRRQIKDCALFVPIISANTQARPEGYFRLEWRLAMVLVINAWDWPRARAAVKRAMELAPGDAEMVSYQAVLAAVMGQTQRAVTLGRQAVELDPLNFFAGYSLVRSLFNLRDYAELEKQVEHLTALNQSGFRLRLFQGASYIFKGRLADAVMEKITIDWSKLMGLACLRFAEGRLEESDAFLNELKATRSDSSAFQVAEIYGIRNQADECFEWLETSFRQRDPGTALIRSDPFFTSMHSDPRWQPFLIKMNLADEQLVGLLV